MSDASLSTSLPARPNLEQQRKRARALLKAARAEDPHALRRFRAVLSDKAQPLSLSAAQLVIAREYGFASWVKLKGHIEAALLSPLGSLALIDAANRALETERSDALYRDAFAAALAGDAGMALLHRLSPLWGNASGPPASRKPSPYLSIRTRFFDEKLKSAVRAHGLKQVVVLGAGLDARAVRIEWPVDLVWFEIDRSEVLSRKERVLRRFQKSRCRRRVVCADLDSDWMAPLFAAGFDSTRPAAFLIEGVVLYLPTATVAHVLRTLRRAASAGSWLGMDLMSRMTVTSPLMTAHLQRLAELDRPSWQFSDDDPERLLALHGWSSKSVIAGSPEANYGRWPFGYAPRDASTPGLVRAFFVEGEREVEP